MSGGALTVARSVRIGEEERVVGGKRTVGLLHLAAA
jgi:hypothetical protein